MAVEHPFDLILHSFAVLCVFIRQVPHDVLDLEVIEFAVKHIVTHFLRVIAVLVETKHCLGYDFEINIESCLTLAEINKLKSSRSASISGSHDRTMDWRIFMIQWIHYNCLLLQECTYFRVIQVYRMRTWLYEATMNKDVVLTLLQNREVWHVDDNLRVYYDCFVFTVSVVLAIFQRNELITPTAEQLIYVFDVRVVKLSQFFGAGVAKALILPFQHHGKSLNHLKMNLLSLLD